MRVFVVLAQAFAVISDHDDERALVSSRVLQIRDEVGERRIGVGDFAIVKMIFVSPRVRRGWLVGIMGIVQMHPNEMRSGRMRFHPGLRVLDDVHSAPLDSSPARLRLRVLGKVVVEIEAAIQARGQGLAVENHRADERGGVITLRCSSSAKVGCAGDSGTAKSVTPCALGSSPVRIVVCEVLVIGLGVKAWVKRIPSLARRIECRCLDIRIVTVAMDVIGAQSVDGDQENIGLARASLRAVRCVSRSP